MILNRVIKLSFAGYLTHTKKWWSFGALWWCVVQVLWPFCHGFYDANVVGKLLLSILRNILLCERNSSASLNCRKIWKFSGGSKCDLVRALEQEQFHISQLRMVTSYFNTRLNLLCFVAWRTIFLKSSVWASVFDKIRFFNCCTDNLEGYRYDDVHFNSCVSNII